MKKRNFLAVLASFAVIASMFSMTANAANYAEADQADGGSTTFKKYLVLDKEANVPNATFKYTIAAGEAIAGTADAMQVYAGKVVKDADDKITAPVVADVTFAAGDSTQDGAATDGITKDETKKYASKEINFDFSGITFDEPGVYRYIVTEDLNGSQGIAVTGSLSKTLDVFVTDNEGKLSVESYVLYNTVINTAPVKNTAVETNTDKTAVDGKKTDGFVNTYDTADLTFGKEVKGNQGSKDKYFEFTLVISNAVAGTKYNVVLDKAEATSGTNAATIAENQGKTNVSEIVVPEGETSVTTNFYLQDGQYITVQGLAKDTKYTLSEDSEDYASAEKIAETDSTFDKDNDTKYDALEDEVNGTVADADIYTGFTNTRQGTIPTGVILSVAAPVVIGLAVLGGIIFLVIRNKKRDAEEEE